MIDYRTRHWLKKPEKLMTKAFLELKAKARTKREKNEIIENAILTKEKGIEEKIEYDNDNEEYDDGQGRKYDILDGEIND